MATHKQRWRLKVVDTLADKLAEVEVLTLSETIAQKKATRLSPHSLTS